jgi:hypothetical protein
MAIDNEITRYIYAYYISLYKAIWQLFEFPIY